MFAASARRLRRELDGGADAAFRRVLAMAAPDLADRLAQRGGGDGVGVPRVFPGLTDAGYPKDPITAHGITDALLDA